MRVRIVELKNGKFAMEVLQENFNLKSVHDKLIRSEVWVRVDLDFLKNDRAEYEDVQILNNSIDSRTIKTVVREQELNGLQIGYQQQQQSCLVQPPLHYGMVSENELCRTFGFGEEK